MLIGRGTVAPSQTHPKDQEPASTTGTTTNTLTDRKKTALQGVRENRYRPRERSATPFGRTEPLSGKTRIGVSTENRRTGFLKPLAGISLF